MNRGVEANEVEIANAHLDSEASQSSAPRSSPRGCYLQVVVEKHARAHVPAACRGGAGDERVQLACSPKVEGRGPRPALRDAATSAGGGERVDGVESCEDALAEFGGGAWAEPACVEVYRFSRVGAWLSCGAAPPTRVERRAARASRRLRAGAAELGACLRLAAGAPLQGARLALRCALQVARDAAAGAVLALSDYALKPALALTFNALVQPALVFVAAAARGAHAALRPACAALAECAAPAAELLRAARLVELHYTCAAPHCACAARARHQPQPDYRSHL